MRIIRFFATLLAVIAFAALLGVAVVIYGLWHFGRGLPDYQQLADYEPAVTTRVHAGDGRLIGEFAKERRLFVPINAIPKRVSDAFLAAEDKNFYSHAGVDPIGVARAVVTNLMNYASGQSRRPVGASTITQQVAKNFLLGNEVSLSRKAKEMILAFRIERAFSKQHILELYLNEIYLGYGAYGVAAAALYYFDKSLDELSIAEAAYLAELPKAPNNYNPLRYPEVAMNRRNWVIGRMAEDGFITEAEAEAARNEPLRIREHRDIEFVAKSEWFAEEVRRELVQRYGEAKLYQGGLSVRTSLDPQLQLLADKALHDGLIAYDRRHGWRGPLARITPGPDWAKQLAAMPAPAGLLGWRVAAVIGTNATEATIGFADGKRGRIPFSEMSWARPWKKDQELGPPIREPRDALQPGDVIAVEAVANAGKDVYALRQIPNVGGAIVVMNPHTGRVLALVGGWDYAQSQFDRAMQAQRQPGSAFKPFVYAAALDHGMTPSSLILDAPFVMDQGPGLPKWRPHNYEDKFHGPTTLRNALEKSLNLVTVRVAQAIGMEAVAETAKKFGVVDDLPLQLSMALGAGDTTLMKMATAYSEFVNGGKKIIPSLIDGVQDRNGRTVFRHDDRPCPACVADVWEHQAPPELPDTRPQIEDPRTAYQIVSMMQGVVERGTGVRIHELGRPLAGKTGTTSDFFDTWFVGFSPDLVAGVFVGFDQPRTLGPREQGAAVAVPIFKEFMGDALANTPVIPFRIPPGVRLVRVNLDSGLPAEPGEKHVILEA
ncbi:MAG TPA: penicillin-binding protein 1A, partial [Candidatus Cybelea sp.]|nr:penicillin-binding protein 1A [Candidatus Cybelea sp.]